MIVECVAPAVAVDIWDRISPMIDAGYAAADEFMPSDMVYRMATGRTLVWVAIEGDDIRAAMTTELVPMRSGLVCWMCQCGGDGLKEWSAMHSKVEEYARAEGCVRVILRGRVGWQRALEGFTVRNVQLEKVL